MRQKGYVCTFVVCLLLRACTGVHSLHHFSLITIILRDTLCLTLCTWVYQCCNCNFDSTIDVYYINEHINNKIYYKDIYNILSCMHACMHIHSSCMFFSFDHNQNTFYIFHNKNFALQNIYLYHTLCDNCVYG